MNDRKPVSITPYLDILYRHRAAGLGVLFVGLGLTACLLVMLPKVYRSTATIMIERPRVAPSYVNLAKDSKPQVINVSDQLEALARTAFRPAALEQVITQFNLYHPRPSEPFSRLVPYMRKHIGLVVPQDSILYLGGNYHQQPPEVLQISFEYPNALTAQQVTAELAGMYIKQAYQDRIERTGDTLHFLATQIDNVKTELAGKENAIKAFERRNEGSLPQELQANSAHLEQLEEHLQAVEDQMMAGRAVPMVGGQLLLTPQQALEQMEVELAKLRAEYSDQYPDVIQLKQQIVNLKQQIRDNRPAAGAAPAAGPDFGQRQLKEQAAALRGQIALLQGRIASTAEHQQELAALSRDYDTVAAEYHDLLGKQLAAQLQQNLEKRHEDERLSLLTPATLPKKAARPNRVAIAMLGVAFSIIAAVLIPFGLYFTDTSFKEPEELEHEYGLPVLVAIPMVDATGERRATALKAALFSSASFVVLAAAIWVYAKVIF